MRSALQVLHMLHARSAYDSLPIDVILDTSKNLRIVEATESIKAGDFTLPPCVPKTLQIRTESNHPWKVPIRVAILENPALLQTKSAAAVADDIPSNARAIDGADDKSSDAVAADDAEKRAPDGTSSKSVWAKMAKEPPGTSDKKPAKALQYEDGGGERVVYTFFIAPEWKAPQCTDDGQWIWEGDESMHPFWAVRRLSSAAVAKEGLEVNTELKEITFTNLAVGAISGVSCSQTMTVTVPFLVPSQNIPKHCQLVLLCEDPPKQTTKRLKNWKNQVDDDAKAAKRPANTRSCGKLATLAQEV